MSVHITREMTDEWKRRALEEGGVTGSALDYPSKLLTLIGALEALAHTVNRHGPCICNTGPGTDGPEEFCPHHGRSYQNVVSASSTAEEAQRRALKRVVEVMERVEDPDVAAAIKHAVTARLEDYAPDPSPPETVFNEEGLSF